MTLFLREKPFPRGEPRMKLSRSTPVNQIVVEVRIHIVAACRGLARVHATNFEQLSQINGLTKYAIVTF
jgi:hypothetical protein